MAAKSSGKVYVAKDSGSAYVEGYGDLSFVKGITRVREGHPLLKGREYLFEDLDLRVDYDVEDTTAAPGEKRGEPAKITPQKRS
jgi:hypothetical protein